MTRGPDADGPPRPAAVLFDWDNTLVDSWRAIHHALAVTFERMGRTPWTLAETRRYVRKSAREAFPELFGDRAAEASEIFYATFEADHLDALQPLPGAEAMLRALHEAGYDLGVVSNKQGRLLRREVERLGWTPWLRALVGAGDAARDKPAPEVVDLVLAGGPAAQAPRERVWLVGDTDIDLACAAAAGCVPVLLRAAGPEPGEFGTAAPRVHVRTCKDLQGLLSAM